jgi:nuclear GTP-binding protein
LDKVQQKHIYDVYGIHEWIDSEDFIKQLAQKTGKLLKGGEPDSNNVCKSLIMDWQRGNIPFFDMPPKIKGEEDEDMEADNIVV